MWKRIWAWAMEVNWMMVIMIPPVAIMLLGQPVTIDMTAP